MYTNVSRSGSSSAVATPQQQQPKLYLQNQLTLSKPSSEEMERPGTRRGGRPGSQSTTTAEEDIQQKHISNTNGYKLNIFKNCILKWRCHNMRLLLKIAFGS